MGRILGIDMGERRIGLAISTPEGALAVPLRILEAQGTDEDTRTIAEIARAEEAESIVVGHPRSLDGTAGPQARRVEAFARHLADVSGLPVELWDERLSSAQAQRSAGGNKRPARKGARRAPNDDIAAAIILQGYLDRQRAADR